MPDKQAQMISDARPGMLGIGLAGATGGLSAVIMDLFQKQDASAIYQLTTKINKLAISFDPTGKFALPVAGVGLLLLIASVLLAFFTEAQSKRAAFYAGASVLAVLMTLVSYTAPLVPEGTTVRQMSYLDGPVDGFGDAFMPAAYAGTGFDGARLWFVQGGGGQIPVSVVVHAAAEGGGPSKITGVLYDAVSKRTYQLGYALPGRASGGTVTYRFDFMIEAGAPAKDNTVADLRLRVEAPGYKTTTANQTVTNAGRGVEMEVTLVSSNVPQFLQRALSRPKE